MRLFDGPEEILQKQTSAESQGRKIKVRPTQCESPTSALIFTGNVSGRGWTSETQFLLPYAVVWGILLRDLYRWNREEYQDKYEAALEFVRRDLIRNIKGEGGRERERVLGKGGYTPKYGPGFLQRVQVFQQQEHGRLAWVLMVFKNMFKGDFPPFPQ